MTATERLRQLLDERGVEWRYDQGTVTWCHDGMRAEAYRGINDLDLVVRMCRLTPEQAIAATLGRGTCKDIAEFRGFGTKTEFKCSECGYEYSAVGGFGCDYGDEPDFNYCPNCGRRVE